MVPIPLTTAPSATVANSSLAIGTGPVSLTRAPYSPARLRSLAACRMASVAALPGSSALKSRIGLNSMKARRSASVRGLSLTSSRQENVAGTLVQHVLDRLGDQVEGPLGAVELDLAALDAGKSGFQRTGQSAQAGIAGHDLDQRRGGFELAGQTGDLGHRQEQQPVLFKELPRAKRLDRFEMLGIASQFLVERGARGVREFRRRRFHHGQDRPVAVESLVELNVALAPIQIRRDQRVDVGVDLELSGGIEARRDRKDECDQDSERRQTVCRL